MKITKEILESNGFEYNKDSWRAKWIRDAEDYTLDLPKYHFNVSNLSNTVDRDWNCHIDNEDFDTVATADIDTIEHFNNLMKLMEINFELKV